MLSYHRTDARVRLAIQQYASATLVYDPRLLSADPELRGFVTDRAADHPALTLQVYQDHGRVLVLLPQQQYVRVTTYCRSRYQVVLPSYAVDWYIEPKGKM